MTILDLQVPSDNEADRNQRRESNNSINDNFAPSSESIIHIIQYLVYYLVHNTILDLQVPSDNVADPN